MCCALSPPACRDGWRNITELTCSGAAALEIEFAFGRRQTKLRSPLPARDIVQRTVDKTRLVGAKKGPRQGDIFVDHHLGRHIAARHQFEHPTAQNEIGRAHVSTPVPSLSRM